MILIAQGQKHDADLANEEAQVKEVINLQQTTSVADPTGSSSVSNDLPLIEKAVQKDELRPSLLPETSPAESAAEEEPKLLESEDSDCE